MGTVRSFHILFLLLSCGLWTIPATALEVFPGAIAVESVVESQANVHQLITGKVKRISGSVQPESVEYVQGLKTARTFSLEQSVQRDALVDFYRNQLVTQGQILFECDGRGCGTSSYWSNEVFNRAQLYGPQEYQHYFLGRIGTDQREYVMVYLAQRATGTRYLHIETIGKVSSEPVADSRLMVSALRLQNRYVIDYEPDSEALVLLRDVIRNVTGTPMALVVHAQLLRGETFEGAVTRTQEHAQSIVDRLEEMGADTRNLVAFGAGAAMPLARGNRIELVKLVSDHGNPQ